VYDRPVRPVAHPLYSITFSVPDATALLRQDSVDKEAEFLVLSLFLLATCRYRTDTLLSFICRCVVFPTEDNTM
jgi:hypothetical protein